MNAPRPFRCPALIHRLASTAVMLVFGDERVVTVGVKQLIRPGGASTGRFTRRAINRQLACSALGARARDEPGVGSSQIRSEERFIARRAGACKGSPECGLLVRGDRSRGAGASLGPDGGVPYPTRRGSDESKQSKRRTG